MARKKKTVIACLRDPAVLTQVLLILRVVLEFVMK